MSQLHMFPLYDLLSAAEIVTLHAYSNQLGGSSTDRLTCLFFLLPVPHFLMRLHRTTSAKMLSQGKTENGSVAPHACRVAG